MPIAEAAKPLWLAVHPLSQEDALGAAALRASVAAFKGKLAGTAARGPFDDLTERVAAPAGVTFEPDTVGGISGLWAKPAKPQKGAAILHLHGGWFNLGTARAYRNFVGHIQLGVTIGTGDFEDQKSLERAARGVDTVFAMSTPFERGTNTETREGINIVRAASSGIPHFDSKFEVEKETRGNPAVDWHRFSVWSREQDWPSLQ